MRIFETLSAKIPRILTHPRLLPGLLFIAVAFNALSLKSGWFADDFWHRFGHSQLPAISEHLPWDQRMNGPMRSYSFFNAPTETTRRLLDVGIYPWWFNPTIQIGFWRPLTGYTLLLDYTLWPETPFFMHAQNILWFLLLVAVSYAVYREIMGVGWAAGLAAFLFVINDSHAMPVSWMANRHILVAAAFGVSCLLLHIRWRKNDRWPTMAGSLACFSFALLSSEGGITTFAYLFAYAVILDKSAISSRIKSLIPYLAIVAVWRAVYSTLGYGVYDVSLYVDPIREPVRFLSELYIRIPILLMGILAWPPPDLYLFLSSTAIPWYAALAFIVIGLAALATRNLWKDCRIAQFWALGMFLSVIPICTAIPSTRNMEFSSLGAMGLLSQLLFNQVAIGMPRPRRIVKWMVLYPALFLLFFIHCVFSPLRQITTPIGTAITQSKLESAIDIGNDPQIAQKDMIFVNSFCAMLPCFIIPYRLLEGLPNPAHIRMLSPGSSTIQMTRIDDRTISVRPKSGYSPPPTPLDLSFPRSHISLVFIVRNLEGLIRNFTCPSEIGDRVELTGVSIEVTDITDDKRIAEATYRFDKPLEDPSFQWMKWNMNQWRYEPYTPPPIGETVTIPFL